MYYKEVKYNLGIPLKFLGHIKKMGIYVESMISILKYACNPNFKKIFSNFKVRKMKLIIINDHVEKYY
jgi:hypothetical protein